MLPNPILSAIFDAHMPRVEQRHEPTAAQLKAIAWELRTLALNCQEWSEFFERRLAFTDA